MAYSKHAWADGELITAEKLNNLENGTAQAAATGLVGDTAILVDLTADANLATAVAKVNEIIAVLTARGISTDVASEPEG